MSSHTTTTQSASPSSAASVTTAEDGHGPGPARLSALDPVNLLKHAQVLQAGLLESLGSNSDLVAHDGEAWQRVRATGDKPVLEPVPCDLAQTLDEHFNPRGTACVDQEKLGQLVILPVAGAGAARCALVSRVRESGPQLLHRVIAKLGDGLTDKVRIEIAEAQINGFMRQVTADFEELTWLRSLATYIELCEVDNSIAGVAAATLPSLAELISAETIALLPQTIDANGTAQVALYAAGDLAVPARTYQNIIEKYGAAAMQGPVVRNLGFGEGVCDNQINIRNVILIRVGRLDRHVGWLVVINKVRNETPATLEPFYDAQSYCESEFGTFEAGMVAAAAVLLGSHAHNVAMFQEQRNLFHGTVKALVNSVDAKDPYTHGHSDRVAQMARRMGQQLQLSEEECEQLYMIGLLHDIGKIGVRDDVLLKPGKLDDDELAVIKKHPEIGCSIVEHVPQLKYALPGIMHHHESLDGTGYPNQLAGEQIAPFARLLAVVDSYDAMTSDRPYRKGMSPAKAEEILRKGAGQQWDPTYVNAFLAAAADMRAICGIRDEPNATAPPTNVATQQNDKEVNAVSPYCDPAALPALQELVPI